VAEFRLAGAVVEFLGHRIELRLDLFQARDARFEQLTGADLALVDQAGEADGVVLIHQGVNVVHGSTSAMGYTRWAASGAKVNSGV